MTVFFFFFFFFFVFFSFVCLFLNYFIPPSHGQPHTAFGVFISLSGGWMLLRKELIMVEDSPRITMLMKCYFTSTEIVGLLGTGAQDGHLDFHTAPELCITMQR